MYFDVSPDMLNIFFQPVFEIYICHICLKKGLKRLTDAFNGYEKFKKTLWFCYLFQKVKCFNVIKQIVIKTLNLQRLKREQS